MSQVFSSILAVGDAIVAITDNPYVVLAIVIISALTSWWQKRNKQSEHGEPWGGEDQEVSHPRRPGTTAPSNQPLNWEEELKRLLENKPPLDSTAGTPPPPPIVRRVPPPPLPAGLPRESLPTDHEGKPSRESAPTPWQDARLNRLPQPTKPLVTLEQSTHAYQRASQLHEAVAARMQRVDDQTEKHGKPLAVTRLVHHQLGSADARAVVALLRQPATARQALLASFVLAPPKALEG